MTGSLASVHPELIPEWSERNLPLTPDKITFGSNKRVWWKGACGHEWETSVKARSKGEKCPICSGARVIEGINDLATLKPLLAQEWSKKNKLKPTEVSVASHKKIIWKCKHGHEWEASVKSRTINGTGCPYCSHNKVLAGFNDLASQYPDIAAEWSDRNLPLLPTMVTAFANSKAWWKCRDCGNEWYTLISTRAGGSRCPYCSGYTLLKGFNDLATTHPDLAAEWSERNYPLMPDEVNAKSRHNVWWKCKTCGNEWKSVINARVKGTVCPVCADRAVLAGYNDLATTDRKLLAEWDYEKNSLLPTQVSRKSMKSVWWKCSLGHSWKAKISDRTIIGEKCTVCENEYRSVFPGLAVAYYANQKGLKVQLGSDKLCVVFFIVLIVELPGILVNRALGLDGSEPTEQVTIVTMFETVTDVISNIIGLGYDSSMTQVETLIADGGYDYDLSMNALVNHAQSSAGYDVAYIMSAYSTSVDQLSASDSDLEAKLSGVSGNMFQVTSVEKENEVITPVTYYTYKPVTMMVVTRVVQTGTINGVPQYRYETAEKTYYVQDEEKTSDVAVEVDAYSAVSVTLSVYSGGSISGTRTAIYYQPIGKQTLTPTKEVVKYLECTIHPFDNSVMDECL